MPRNRKASLWDELIAADDLSARLMFGAGASVDLGSLVGGSALGRGGGVLRGRSVLVMTTDQLTTALALIELDGIARRFVLCPPDLPAAHLAFVTETAAVDAIVSDRTSPGTDVPAVPCFITCSPKIAPGRHDRD